MRDYNILNKIPDYSTFMEYLYMGEEHSITFSNKLTTLTLRMNDKLEIFATNNTFPNVPPMNFTNEMTLANVLGIIEQLKETKPEQFTKFENKWEEIKEITLVNKAHNKSIRS